VASNQASLYADFRRGIRNDNLAFADTRPGSAGVSGEPVASLHGAGLRLRARVWWPTVSLERFVAEPADALAELWALPELAEDAFDELKGLAQQSRLRADQRLARILFVLTAGSVAIAVAALIVQVATSSAVPAAVVAAVVPSAVAALASWWIYGRTFR
jgi:hypothetical protein